MQLNKLFRSLLISALSLGLFFSGPVLAEAPADLDPKEETCSSKDEIAASFGPYMRDLQKAIKQEWKPPRGKESEKLIATFSVSKEGELRNLKLTQESDTEEANLAALEAIENASPFAPLPEGFDKEEVDIEFTFDYNVFKKKQQNSAISNALQKVNFKPYMKKLQKIIKKEWHPPRGTESSVIVTTFTVHNDGSVDHLNIKEEAPLLAANHAALEAIKAAAPLPPLPKDFKGDSVDIEFSFDYNVFYRDENGEKIEVGSTESFRPVPSK